MYLFKCTYIFYLNSTHHEVSTNLHDRHEELRVNGPIGLGDGIAVALQLPTYE